VICDLVHVALRADRERQVTPYYVIRPQAVSKTCRCTRFHGIARATASGINELDRYYKLSCQRKQVVKPRLTPADTLHNLPHSLDDNIGSWISVSELGSVISNYGIWSLTGEFF